jgi:hypothetical protein
MQFLSWSRGPHKRASYSEVGVRPRKCVNIFISNLEEDVNRALILEE